MPFSGRPATSTTGTVNLRRLSAERPQACPYLIIDARGIDSLVGLWLAFARLVVRSVPTFSAWLRNDSSVAAAGAIACGATPAPFGAACRGRAWRRHRA